MITAHLAGGYVLARAIRAKGAVFAATLIGATWPDLDLIWFYFIDDRAVHHHRYWVHAPAFCVAVSMVLLGAARLWKPTLLPVFGAFALGWFVHILLDSIVGDVMWLWPYSTELVAIATVPATRSHWILSFIFHWSFLLELAIWALAIWLWFARPRHD